MAEWKSRRHLEDHLAVHGREIGLSAIGEYDESAQETMRVGEIFGYEDPTTGDRHAGYYDRLTGRFTATDEDGRIVSHFACDDYIDWLREEGDT